MAKISTIRRSGAANDAVAVKIAPASSQRGRGRRRAMIHAVATPAESPEPENITYPRALPAKAAVTKTLVQTPTTARSKNGTRAANVA